MPRGRAQISTKSDILQLRSIHKTFPNGSARTTVLDQISLEVRENEFLTLLGPSGCGKTTLLRIIAGLEATDRGEVWLDGVNLTGLPPYQRSVNTVFQNYALFPHMTVAQNVAFGLIMQRQPKATIQQAVQDTLKLIHLEDFAHRYPDQLSGGQQQRVALARALVNHPKVLLLDESLSALDYKLRKQMQIELKHLQRNTGITFIFVTHDQDEALSMSDRIAVMENGYIAQLGTPQEIYHEPKSRFVANFIGNCNFIKAATLGLEGVDVGFRPESVSIAKDSAPAIGSTTGCLTHISYHGPTTHYFVKLDSGETVTIAQEGFEHIAIGDRLSLRPYPERLIRCHH